ncbi:PadR family transcriptional regulator [Paenibacillus sp. CGMCC 1.16610]|uniref:PadR family transcriptional regulator n=2 Tax=Paenibacillus anseongense TaxID=2682845 RepID=A0ABW9UF38_9BACL|nr:PadR family transcriptional regulator [Paenibacillus sp. CGMCC 1.16610]MBA2938587.1 PadR family transcriptional regulator [Paenibacillus sp. CGMCC 1.16610]MVQ38779.1 PadR family transcriptional regulator [Paenibacillus anseongense]
MKNKTNKPQRSPLALAILANLAQEPMHPYRMQQLIKERGKDEVINVRQRTSIYQTIDRLLREGLISVQGTLSEGGRPDRTVYELTEEGRETSKIWLREMLSARSQEYPDFPAAISFLTLLTPEDVQRQFERREGALQEEIQRTDAQLLKYKESVPRLFMLEVEHSRALLQAELEWLRAVIEDLRTGELSWNEEWISQIAARLSSPN